MTRRRTSCNAFPGCYCCRTVEHAKSAVPFSSHYCHCIVAKTSSTGTAATATAGDASGGLIAYGIICFIFVIIFTSYLIHLYARPKCPPLAIILTWLSWLITFSLCFLVPIDLLPNTGAALDTLWSVIFWMSFLLMWVIVPVISGYYDNGGFTVRQKLSLSLRSLFYYLVIILIFCVIIIIYLMAAADWAFSDISGAVILASTTWGLVMLVIGAGWGLVEVPRDLYRYTNIEWRRDFIYFSAANIHQEADDTRDEFAAILLLLSELEPKMHKNVRTAADPNHTRTQLTAALDDETLDLNGEALESDDTTASPAGAAADTTVTVAVPFDDTVDEAAVHLRYFQQIQQCVREKQLEFEQSNRHNGPHQLTFRQDLLKSKTLTLKQLHMLHHCCRTTVKHLTAVDTRWRDTVRLAERLEIDISNQQNTQHISWWLGSGKKNFLRITWISFAILSLLILVCEAFIPLEALLHSSANNLNSDDDDTSVNISPLGVIVAAVQNQFLLEQIFSAIPLIYLSICAYYGLFNLHFGMFYYVGEKATDESTLLFNSCLLLRMSAPLAYNFTLLLNLKADSLANLIGQITVIPFFGGSFTTIFPLFMIGISGITLFNLINYIGVFLNMKALKFVLVSDALRSSDSDIKDDMEEGKRLIQLELKRIKGETASQQREQRRVATLAEREKRNAQTEMAAAKKNNYNNINNNNSNQYDGEEGEEGSYDDTSMEGEYDLEGEYSTSHTGGGGTGEYKTNHDRDASDQVDDELDLENFDGGMSAIDEFANQFGGEDETMNDYDTDDTKH